MKASSSDSYYIDLLNTVITRIYQYGNLTIYILGTVGDLLSIYIFLTKKWRKNVCVFYFLICLLLSLIYLNSTILATSLITGWRINAVNSSIVLCKLMFYVTFVVALLLPTILILASIDRLLISSQNVDTRLYSSRRLAYLLIGISIVFWTLFNLHILVRVHIQQIGPSSVICYYDLSSAYFNFVNYSLTVFNCSFCLLMIVLSIFAFKNVRRIRSLPRQQPRIIRTMTKKDFQLLRCLFVHDVVYISVSVISSVYAVYQITSRDQKRTPLQSAIANFLVNLFTFIYFTYYCCSFFIFVCVSKAFRQEVKQLIFKTIGKDIRRMGGREEQQQAEPNNIALNVEVVSGGVM